MKNKVSYISSNSIVGSHFTLKVNDKLYDLYPGNWRYESKHGDVYDHAIFILKSKYGIVKYRHQITFIWDNSL